jgi:hypothetical protein
MRRAASVLEREIRMNDFDRDPDLIGVRELWRPPNAPESLDQDVLQAFRQSQSPPQLRRAWLFALAAIVIASIGVVSGIFLDRAIRPIPKSPGELQMRNGDENKLVPVKQPRLVVISRGEQP